MLRVFETLFQGLFVIVLIPKFVVLVVAQGRPCFLTMNKGVPKLLALPSTRDGHESCQRFSSSPFLPSFHFLLPTQEIVSHKLFLYFPAPAAGKRKIHLLDETVSYKRSFVLLLSAIRKNIHF